MSSVSVVLRHLLSSCWGGVFPVLLLTGCTTTSKISGKRELVVPSSQELAVDNATLRRAFKLPNQRVEKGFRQEFESATHEMAHHRFDMHKAQFQWFVSVGGGTTQKARLITNLVSEKGRIFGANTDGDIFAIDIASQKILWKVSPVGRIEDVAKIAGMALLDTGDLLVAAASGEVIILASDSGRVKKKVELHSSLRSAPTVAGGTLVFQGSNNSLFVLDSQLNTLWSLAEAPENVVFLGNGSPAVEDGVVVAAYTTGEYKAYDIDSGAELWMSFMTPQFADDTVSSMLHIHASPVIQGDRVFVVGHSGSLTATHLLSGQELWSVPFSGLHTPVASGDWLFAVDAQGYLYCFDQATGRVRWSAALPDDADHKRPTHWTAPLLAGDCILIVTDFGNIVAFDASTGKVARVLKSRALSPSSAIIVNQQLFVLSGQGRLYAFGS